MFKLRLQFFIVILILTSLLTAGLYLFLKNNFKRDFWHYIEKKETRFAQPLINNLIENYRVHKNWEWIGDWHNYVSQHFDIETNEHPYKMLDPTQPISLTQHTPINDAQELNGRPHPNKRNYSPEQSAPNIPEEHARDWREFRHRPPAEVIHTFFLLDEKHQLIAGENINTNDDFLLPLTADGKTVGYLGIPFNPAFRDLPDINFATGQEQKLAFVIIIALFIASMAAFPLAHFLTQRINNLVAQVGHLNRGNYQEKISVKGHDELSVLAEHLNNLGGTLAQSENTRRQWVADISHELRTPIAVLQAELEAMEDGVRPLNKATIKRLTDHSQRLKRLVNDLYELSLTDLGGMAYRKNNVDLAILLQNSVKSMQPQFMKSHITLKLISKTAGLIIFADADRLQQLFSNLLKNSLQYTNTPGETRVTLTHENQQAAIVIEDSAPGVDEAHHGKLFDRLYRADSSRNRSTGGAGLGLSICKNIVAAHEGQIAISNSDLGGLKITISFPVKKDT